MVCQRLDNNISQMTHVNTLYMQNPLGNEYQMKPHINCSDTIEPCRILYDCTPKVVKAHWRYCMIMKRRRKKINLHWLKISHFLLINRAAVRIARLSLRDAMEHYDTYNLIGWLLWPRTIKLNSFTHHLYWKKLRFVNLLDNCSSVQLSIVTFFTKQRSVWNVVIIIITVGFNALPHRMHLLHT